MNSWSALSADGNTAIAGSPTTGVFARGPSGPACTFQRTVNNES